MIWEKGPFDKNIIQINEQLKMPYIYNTIENRMLVFVYDTVEPIFYLTVQCDKFLLGHYLELS